MFNSINVCFHFHKKVIILDILIKHGRKHVTYTKLTLPNSCVIRFSIQIDFKEMWYRQVFQPAQDGTALSKVALLSLDLSHMIWYGTDDGWGSIS